MRVLSTDAAGIAAAAEALRAGEVIAYPTETVYGLGADPFNPDALERLFRVKGRDARNAVLLVVADDAQLCRIVSRVSAAAQALMERFWPGPLSLLLPPVPGLDEALIGPTGKVCVRCTAHPAAQAICASFGGAITSTSANRSGEAPARRAGDIHLEGLAVILDGGELALSAPSTVYDPDLRQIVREGAISEHALAAFRAI